MPPPTTIITPSQTANKGLPMTVSCDSHTYLMTLLSPDTHLTTYHLGLISDKTIQVRFCQVHVPLFMLGSSARDQSVQVVRPSKAEDGRIKIYKLYIEKYALLGVCDGTVLLKGLYILNRSNCLDRL